MEASQKPGLQGPLKLMELPVAINPINCRALTPFLFFLAVKFVVSIFPTTPMRKVLLQMQVTLDGFTGGPGGEMDWMSGTTDEALDHYSRELAESADVFLLGRVTAQGMAVYWPTVPGNPQSSEQDLWMADRLKSALKIVFSRTLSSLDWEGTRVVKEMTTEVEALKRQKGKALLLYGGAGIAGSFIRQHLVDEYHLFVHPVAIGCGKPLFTSVEDKLKLRLVHSQGSPSGIVVLCYRPG